MASLPRRTKRDDGGLGKRGPMHRPRDLIRISGTEQIMTKLWRYLDRSFLCKRRRGRRELLRPKRDASFVLRRVVSTSFFPCQATTFDFIAKFHLVLAILSQNSDFQGPRRGSTDSSLCERRKRNSRLHRRRDQENAKPRLIRLQRNGLRNG